MTAHEGTSAREGERPSSEYSAEEITYARALDWLRVDDRGFGYISREGVEAIAKVRKRAPFASATKVAGREARCEVTGNLCGTDTWIVGYDCKCVPCSAFVASVDDTQPMAALSSTDVVELPSSDLVTDEDYKAAGRARPLPPPADVSFEPWKSATSKE